MVSKPDNIWSVTMIQSKITSPTNSENSLVSPSTRHYGSKLTEAARSLSALALLPIGAQAGIVHVTDSPFSLSFNTPGNTFVPWDVDGVGGVDFQLWHSVTSTSGGAVFNHLNMGTGLNGSMNGQGFAIKSGDNDGMIAYLPTGLRLSPALVGSHVWGKMSNHMTVLISTSGTKATPSWLHVGDNSIGFKFLSDAHTLFGWANLNLDTVAGIATINDWAYNTTPNGSIRVGQTVPEPSTLSLSLLGLGLGGLRVFRSRNSRAVLN